MWEAASAKIYFSFLELGVLGVLQTPQPREFKIVASEVITGGF